jgi:hypothetical protein
MDQGTLSTAYSVLSSHFPPVFHKSSGQTRQPTHLGDKGQKKKKSDVVQDPVGWLRNARQPKYIALAAGSQRQQAFPCFRLGELKHLASLMVHVHRLHGSCEPLCHARILVYPRQAIAAPLSTFYFPCLHWYMQAQRMGHAR